MFQGLFPPIDKKNTTIGVSSVSQVRRFIERDETSRQSTGRGGCPLAWVERLGGWLVFPCQIFVTL